MRMKLGHACIVVVTVGLLWLGPVLAEEAAPTPSLTLQDCIAIALQQQIDILVGEETVAGAKDREKQAKAAYYPQVSVQDSRTLVKSGRAIGQLNGTSLSVSQNFYDGGVREAQIRGARAGVLQSVFGLERTKQTVVFNVTSDYLALLRAQQLVGVQDARVKYLEEQHAWVQTRVEVGDAAKVDLLPVEAQLANAVVDQLSARNSVRTAAVQLQSRMGLSPQLEFPIQEVAAPTTTEIGGLDDYLKVALASRPEIGQTEAAVESARSSVQSARIALRPRPVISGQFNQPFSGQGGSSLAITGGIAFDLFTGGRNQATYQEARTSLSTAELRAAQLEKDIQADIQKAYLNLTSAKDRLAASDLSLQAAQTNFDAQEGRYKQGLAITLDLLNAQSEVVTAQSNAVQARYDYYTSTAQLQYAIGKQGDLNEK